MCLGSAGTLVHWAEVNVRRPGWPEHTRLHGAAGPGRLRCELQVLSCARVRLGRRAAAKGWRGEEAWEAVVELRTGRTHQARPALPRACRAELDARLNLRWQSLRSQLCIHSSGQSLSEHRIVISIDPGLAAWACSPPTPCAWGRATAGLLRRALQPAACPPLGRATS